MKRKKIEVELQLYRYTACVVHVVQNRKKRQQIGMRHCYLTILIYCKSVIDSRYLSHDL